MTRPCRKRAEQILLVRSGYKHTGIPGSQSTRVCAHRRPNALSHTSRTLGLTPECGPGMVAFNSATARSARRKGGLPIPLSGCGMTWLSRALGRPLPCAPFVIGSVRAREKTLVCIQNTAKRHKQGGCIREREIRGPSAALRDTAIDVVIRRSFQEKGQEERQRKTERKRGRKDQKIEVSAPMKGPCLSPCRWAGPGLMLHARLQQTSGMG